MNKTERLDSLCPLCASENYASISDKDRHGKKLMTVLCQVCGHVFSNPQPLEKDLGVFYAKDYRAQYKGTLTPKFKHVYRAGCRALERARDLSDYISPERSLLDIGSGGGEFLYLMQKLGISAAGIEPNIGYANFASAQYGVKIEVSRVEDLVNTAKLWDLITIHHVLEHLLSPVEVLKSIAGVLSPNGVLVVEVPNIEANYHAPKRQFHPAHIHTFSSEGLIFAANQAGLELVRMRIMPHTRHLNAIFRQSPFQIAHLDPSVADRIFTHLKYIRKGSDFLSSRSYQRLYSNIKRPFKEYYALFRLGMPKDPRILLDSLYGSPVFHKVRCPLE